MAEPINRAMLRMARAVRGFTQGQLAKRASVTQALISKLENGLTTDPTPDTVASLASALGYPESLLRTDERPHGLPPFHYRKRARMGVRILNKIEADITIRQLHWARMLRSFEVETEREFPAIDLDKNLWTPQKAAEFLRGYWLVPRGPIENLTELVERGGAVIIQIDFDTTLLDALSIRIPGMPPLVFMNSRMPGDRYRFSLAHELAHLILHNHPETDDNMETQADEFAAEFLMPMKEIRPHISYPSLGKLARVKAHWKVSIKSLIVRAHRLKLITPNQYTGLNVNYSKAGYGRNGEPYPIPVEEPSTLASTIRYHLNDLGYSVGDLASLLLLEPTEFIEMYGPFDPPTLGRPKLTLVP